MGQAETRGAAGKMKRWQKVAVGVGSGLVVMAAGLLAVCWFVGIRSMADVASYRAMRREGFHPVWKDLAWRRFRRGSDVESLVRKHEASQREEAGVYLRLVYGAGDEHGRVTVVAKNGRLTAAVAETRVGRHVFFYDLERMLEFGQAHKEYTEQKRAEMDVVRIDRAMRAGRDIFLGRPGRDGQTTYFVYKDRERRELVQRLKAIADEHRLETEAGFQMQMTVEVAEVLRGEMERGATMTITIDNQCRSVLHDPETMFVGEEVTEPPAGDDRGGRRYRPVSKRAWELYRSLTAEEVAGLEARWSGEMAAKGAKGR